MANVVVTGAAGFIGSHVCEALLDRGDTVTGIDNFNTFYDPAIKEGNAARLESREGFTLVRGTILDPQVRDRGLGVAKGALHDVVIHLCAWAGVRPSIENPALYQRENIEGTVGLLDVLREQKALGNAIPRFVFASSSSVYGKNKKVPFSELDDVSRPISPYAATKRAGELLAFTYHHLFGLDISCLRFFTVYGPRQRPEMAIHKFAKLMSEGKSIPMFGDGESARDYTFIADIVSGVLAAADRCAGYEIYNLGNSQTIKLKDLIAKIGKVLGVEPRIDRLPDQPGDVPLTYADISKAQEKLGYAPKTSIDDGLAEFGRWFKGHEGASGA
jgi:UDP-glucuronate 4-epimerase